ncbi:MAG TPA: hypothetical protein VG797_06895 [Phycisphaerales bacterium]|nr:hypothetical protein [Phycisphaerales bacterium]
MKQLKNRWTKALLGAAGGAALLASSSAIGNIVVPGNTSCDIQVGGPAGIIITQNCPSGMTCCNHPIYAPDGQLLFSFETCCEAGTECHVWLWFEIGAQQIFCF